MKKKKYLVTGGAGFIGSAIVKKLISENFDITVLDNLQRGNLIKLAEVKGKFNFVSADIRDTKKVEKAARGCNGIIHLAYVNGTKFFYSKPDIVLDIAIKGMLSIINAGKVNNISELYLASSSEVYQVPNIVPTPEDIPLVVPDPYNPRYSYGGGKILSELMAIHMGKDYFKKIVIFRPHNVYGPNMGEEHVIPEFIRRMETLSKNKKSNNFKIQGTGKETRSYIFIDDFVNAFSLLIKKGKHLNTYNIGTQNETTSNTLANLIAELFDKKIKIIPTNLAQGSTPRRYPDITKIQSLDFTPKINLKTGLTQTIDWYLAHPKKV